MLPLYLGFFLVAFLAVFKNRDPKESTLDMRRKQASQWTNKNILSKTIEKNLQDKVKTTRKMDVENLCYRAGYIVDYYVLLTYRICIAVLFLLIVQFLTRNIPLALVGAFAGFFLPMEFMKFNANRRSKALDSQIGVVMRMIAKRYGNNSDMKDAIEQTTKDMEGQEPVYTELARLCDDMNLGVPVEDALTTSAARLDNRFFIRFAAFYGVSSEAGTRETKASLLNQAIEQYEENQKIKVRLVKALREPTVTAYIMIAFVPFAVLAGKSSNPDYVKMMTQTLIGKIGSAFIIASVLFSIWFVNTKMLAPIDIVKRKKKK